MKKELILASASPRRKEILAILGYPFTVKESGIKETAPEGLEPAKYVGRTARDKARKVAEMSKGLIIGADTVVVHQDRVLGKPRDNADAERMLKDLSSSIHEVMTGIVVIDSDTGKEASACEITRVYFRHLGGEEIRGYVATGEPIDKAGSYAIQGVGAVFVEKIEGCYFNVVGLPIFRLYRMLASFGINIFT